MIQFYKKSFPATLGVFLSILCVVSLIQFMRELYIDELEYIMEYLHFLAISIVSGFVGIPLFFYGIEKITNEHS